MPNRLQLLRAVEGTPGQTVDEDTLLTLAGADPVDKLEVWQELKDLEDHGYLESTSVTYYSLTPAGESVATHVEPSPADRIDERLRNGIDLASGEAA